MSATARHIVLAVLVTAAATPFAHAQETNEYDFSDEAIIEVSLDHHESLNILSLKAEYVAALNIGGGWTVGAGIVLEPVDDVDSSSAFNSQDAYVDSLSIEYVATSLTLRAGKFVPASGIAASETPGLFGPEIGEAYELAERIGAGFDVELGQYLDIPGVHVLSATAFTADRSALSSSMLGLRDRMTLEDGGPGNTSGLRSFAGSIDGTFESGAGYSASYRRLPQVQGPAEEMLTLAAFGSGDETNPLSWIGEVALVKNADGASGARRQYYTLGGVWDFSGWWIGAIASGRKDLGVNSNLDRVELTVGASVSENAAIDVGLQHVDDADASYLQLGLRLTFTVD